MGALTHGDVQGLLTAVVSVLQQTSTTPRVRRFAVKVLGKGNTAANQVELKGANPGLPASARGLQPEEFSRLRPEEPAPPSAHALRPAGRRRRDRERGLLPPVKTADLTTPTVNTRSANAPASYPRLWTPPARLRGVARHRQERRLARCPHLVMRNVGEVLGVFGDFAIPAKRRRSCIISAMLRRLASSYPTTLENLLKTLWSPQWPADFPKVDLILAAAGAKPIRPTASRATP